MINCTYARYNSAKRAARFASENRDAGDLLSNGYNGFFDAYFQTMELLSAAILFLRDRRFRQLVDAVLV